MTPTGPLRRASICLIVEGDGVEGDGVERHELDRLCHRIDLNGLRGELDKLQRTAASR